MASSTNSSSALPSDPAAIHQWARAAREPKHAPAACRPQDHIGTAEEGHLGMPKPHQQDSTWVDMHFTSPMTRADLTSPTMSLHTTLCRKQPTPAVHGPTGVGPMDIPVQGLVRVALQAEARGRAGGCIGNARAGRLWRLWRRRCQWGPLSGVEQLLYSNINLKHYYT